MHNFFADLHIHSKYSRATSKKLNPRNLAAWGTVKGLDILATSDFTHPGWMQELEENLVQEDCGLLRLRDPQNLGSELPWLERTELEVQTRFMLCTEISSIYKKKDKVRKNHNLVFMPNLEKAKAFTQRLAQIGNLKADGRPILGLDARNLLEMVLETDDQAFLIPAHIWTPWFSLFGSKSGFDSLEECFGDLSSEIFALETGLSSDPDMNWLWSSLDKYRLVSNSDAHSGEKLGREANLFKGEPSYNAILEALKDRSHPGDFLGTVEFFPQEGKYHLDGHRKCGVTLDPRETKACGGICPVCGRPLTVGVLNRVLALADRKEPLKPASEPGYKSLIPLPEVLSEILGVGPKSKTVYRNYARLLRQFGSEMTILNQIPPEELRTANPLLAEGIKRMREGNVYFQSGFDGQYGQIRVFSPRELKEAYQGARLTSQEDKKHSKSEQAVFKDQQTTEALPSEIREDHFSIQEYNPDQQKAILEGPNPVLVVAGPGTGKTKTLLGRVQSLLQKGQDPGSILILTFTRAAARELRERLVHTLGPETPLPRSDTLHALAFEHFKKQVWDNPLLLSEEEAEKLFMHSNPELEKREARQAWKRLALAREKQDIDESLLPLLQNYQQQKSRRYLADYTDLLEAWLSSAHLNSGQRPYQHLLVDEVQDLSHLQISVVQTLLASNGHGLFAIGDPKQSIYGFRGAISKVEQELGQIWPSLRLISLKENYRSGQNILDLSSALFTEASTLTGNQPWKGEINYYQAASASQEAHWIADQSRQLLGETSHLQADQGQSGELSPGDIAVLVRFRGLISPIQKSLERAGLPCFVPEKQAFWLEPRIEQILQAINHYLGNYTEENEITERLRADILDHGPSCLVKYLSGFGSFDPLFFKSSAFREMQKAYKTQGSWKELLNWINWQNELELARGKAEKIRIMTLHASKGLEFSAVFLPALEEGILPFWGLDSLLDKQSCHFEKEKKEEEKRLFYVGLTRAKKYLFLSQSQKRELYGRSLQMTPSSLVQGLPQQVINITRSVAKKKKTEQQLRLI